MSATTSAELRVQATARPTDVVSATDTATPVVKWWATLGVVVVVFIAYVMIKWVTGPYFKRVPAGPTHVPTWMHIELTAWQVVSIPVALFLLYWFVVRPWRRDRHVGVDGILLIGFAMTWFQDPLSAAGGNWFTYNSSLVNFGSWVNSTPGFAGWGQPGHMIPEPVLFTFAAYVYILLIPAVIGCWSMRWARRRWPGITTAGLVTWCYVTLCVFDFVLEGLIWMPLGIYELPGGPWAIFANTYHKFPLIEPLTASVVFTTLACLRFFTNDKGQMWIERGIDKVGGGPGKKLALRGLAAIGAIQLIMFFGYTVPNTAVGFNSTAWPKDLQNRSYLNDGLCGAGTNRLCPGPVTGNMRAGAAYIGANGKVVVPAGKTLPTNVPLKK